MSDGAPPGAGRTIRSLFATAHDEEKRAEGEQAEQRRAARRLAPGILFWGRPARAAAVRILVARVAARAAQARIARTRAQGARAVVAALTGDALFVRGARCAEATGDLRARQAVTAEAVEVALACGRG